MAACSYLNHSRRLTATFRMLFSPSTPLIRRTISTSVYDKNPEEHALPSLVPDQVIHPQSDQYWAPHPKTGVFGPATEHNPAGAAVNTTTPTEDSVLELKAFFRPHEDLEKPPPQS